MQSCFREHPDIYGPELSDEGDEEDDALLEEEIASSKSTTGPAVESGTPSKSMATSADVKAPTPSRPSSEIPAAATRSDPTEAHAINKADTGHVPASYRPADSQASTSEKTQETKTSAGQLQSTASHASESEELVPKAAHDARS